MSDIKPPFFVKTSHEWVSLRVHDIQWITKSTRRKNYLSIHYAMDQLETKMSLSKVLTYLPEKDFVRVHNSFVIRVDQITSISAGFAHVKVSQKRIPVGEAFLPELLLKFNLLK